MKFKTALDLPDGLTIQERDSLLTRYERTLDDGSLGAHDWMASDIFKRGVARTAAQAVEFADYLQKLAARLRMERGLEHPGGLKVGGKTRG